mgnify:FL=1
MGIRLPLKTVLDVNNSTINATGPASTVGGVANTFTLPQDTDNIVVKLEASVMGGGVSAVLQTSDNGGSTWFDVARTSIVSNTAGSVLAQWLSTPVIGTGVATTTQIGSIVATGSTISAGSIYGAIGSAGASTLGQLTVSGLPILGTFNRVFLRYTAAVTSIISERVQVKVNSESHSD